MGMAMLNCVRNPSTVHVTLFPLAPRTPESRGAITVVSAIPIEKIISINDMTDKSRWKVIMRCWPLPFRVLYKIDVKSKLGPITEKLPDTGGR